VRRVEPVSTTLYPENIGDEEHGVHYLGHSASLPKVFSASAVGSWHYDPRSAESTASANPTRQGAYLYVRYTPVFIVIELRIIKPVDRQQEWEQNKCRWDFSVPEHFSLRVTRRRARGGGCYSLPWSGRDNVDQSRVSTFIDRGVTVLQIWQW